MLRAHLIINGQVWQVHLNEDSSKLGCDILKREIWADGTKDEIRENLTRFLTIASDYEYGVANAPGIDEVEYISEKIMMAFGIRL